jgi:hypothetical protein
MVSIVAFQAVDPSSILGRRMFCSLILSSPLTLESGCELYAGLSLECQFFPVV